MFETILCNIAYITGIIVIVWSMYYLFLYLASTFKVKRKYPIVEDKQRFCIFIPCHNEEDVIGATVENMSKIEYNPSLVDFYIIADNCKDKTAEVANDRIKQLNLTNFQVLERNVTDAKKNGKPHALRWGIKTLEDKDEFYNKYDMFMILDADNFVDKDILKHINSQYEFAKPNKKPCMIQCYLDSKNANNIIAKGYNYSYRIFSNRATLLAKKHLGLNACICGTGFIITTKFLKEVGGFNAKSLTEDLEIQTMANIRNKIILYNPYVRVYDEKPTGLKQSYVQRTRWAKGYWYVGFKFIPRLLISLFNFKSFRNFFSKIDNIMQLLSSVMTISMIINFLCSIIAFFAGINLWTLSPYGTGIPAQIINIAISVFTLILFPLCAILQDGTEREKHLLILKLPLINIALLIITAIHSLATLHALFTWPNQGKWAKTKHVQTVNTNVDEKANITINSETKSQTEKNLEVIYMQQPLQEIDKKEESDKKKVKVSVT